MESILIKNGTVVTLGENNQVLHNHHLLIRNGVIEKIVPSSNCAGKCQVDRVIDARGKLVMPGFINAHMHFYSSFARGLGKALPSRNFPEILENLWWRLDKKLTLEDSYYSAMVACIDAIKHGTTTLIDHHASPMAIKGSLNQVGRAVKETGLRANLCYELSDRDGEKISNEGIEENIDFIRECESRDDEQLKALFGLHASFTIEDKTMEKVAKFIEKSKAGIHIHCGEDISDQEQTLKMSGVRVVERLNKFGFLKANTILAHGVHLNHDELELVKKNDTIIVHNPQSNMNNAVGVADLLKMHQMGILVGLGTDAMTVNMLEELRSAHWIHKIYNKNPSVGFMECANSLVVNNAKIANRFWDGLGELKIGNKADVILMDYFTPTPLTAETFLGHLIFGISQSVVDTTIAGGKILMENKKLTFLDEEQIMKEALKLSTSLWERF